MILFLIFAIFAACLLPILAEIVCGEFTFFNPKNLFLAYYLVLFGMSGLLMVVGGPSTLFSRDYLATPEVYVEGLWIALLGAIAFQCGYYVQRTATLPVPKLLLAPWPRGRINVVVAACYAAGALAFLSIVREAGGLGNFLLMREVWRAGGLKGHGIAILCATTLVANATHVLFLQHATPRTPRRTFALLFIAYGLASVPAIIFGFRSAVAIPLLQLFLLWNFRRGVVSPVGISVVFGVFALGFTVYGIQREVPTGVSLSFEQARTIAAEHPDLVFNVIARTRGVEILSDVVHRLHETGEFDTSPKSIIEALTIMVPASIWKDKPLSAGERFSTYFYRDDFAYSRGSAAETIGGVSPTITAEFYWHLGIVGVVVGLFLLGLGCRVVYRTVREHASSNGVLLVYATLYTSIGLMAEFFQIYVNTLVLDLLMLAVMLFGLTAVWSSRRVLVASARQLS